jgi:DNA-directed RNA polymerase specialized sigma24 family protein
LTVIERVLDTLRQEFSRTVKEEELERLKSFLTGEEPRSSYREVASELGTTEGAVKASVHRLRARFGKLRREEIAETVANPDDVDDEVRHLLGVIAPWEPQRT